VLQRLLLLLTLAAAVLLLLLTGRSVCRPRPTTTTAAATKHIRGRSCRSAARQKPIGLIYAPARRCKLDKSAAAGCSPAPTKKRALLLEQRASVVTQQTRQHVLQRRRLLLLLVLLLLLLLLLGVGIICFCRHVCVCLWAVATKAEGRLLLLLRSRALRT
jgi:hypothetical protein